MSKYKDWIYWIYAIIGAVFFVATMKFLTIQLEILSHILQKALDQGMSIEFQFIFVVISLYVTVQIFGYLGSVLFTSLKRLNKKGEKE